MNNNQLQSQGLSKQQTTNLTASDINTQVVPKPQLSSCEATMKKAKQPSKISAGSRLADQPLKKLQTGTINYTALKAIEPLLNRMDSQDVKILNHLLSIEPNSSLKPKLSTKITSQNPSKLGVSHHKQSSKTQSSISRSELSNNNSRSQSRAQNRSSSKGQQRIGKFGSKAQRDRSASPTGNLSSASTYYGDLGREKDKIRTKGRRKHIKSTQMQSEYNISQDNQKVFKQTNYDSSKKIKKVWKEINDRREKRLEEEIKALKLDHFSDKQSSSPRSLEQSEPNSNRK